MPQWIHDRAEHILGKNPNMPRSMAFALATQQSHATGKSPKGFGTTEGRRTAKEKYPDSKTYERRSNPDKAKVAFIEALPSLAGLASGYSPGRELAGEAAGSVAPRGRVNRSERIARNVAAVAVPLGGLAGMALAKRYNLAPKITQFAKRHFPGGLIAEPAAEEELFRIGVPGAAAILGSMGGGAATGAAVGGLQRLRGPHRQKTAAPLGGPSPMWSTIGGAFKKPAWRAQSGFTPPGMETSVQRLSKSMNMGAFNRDKGLKPLDIKVAFTLGELLVPITKAAENEGFSTNQYSGVMNPAPMVYRSGIPSWNEPPVKTAGPPSDKTKKAAPTTPLGRLSSARAIGAPRATPAPGPSIAQIAKPKGYGQPLAGAIKSP